MFRSVLRFACLLSISLSVPWVQARPADCQLVVDGKTLMKGRCEFDASPDGSFRIEGATHIAHVMVEKPGVGSGDWSAKPDNRSSYKETGELRRSGACWANSSTRICAWGPGQGPKSK